MALRRIDKLIKHMNKVGIPRGEMGYINKVLDYIEDNDEDETGNFGEIIKNAIGETSARWSNGDKYEVFIETGVFDSKLNYLLKI